MPTKPALNSKNKFKGIFSAHSTLWSTLLIVTLCLVVFGRGLWGGFVMDDWPAIKEISKITEVTYIPNYFTHSVWANTDLADQVGLSGTSLYRPLFLLTLNIGYQLWKTALFAHDKFIENKLHLKRYLPYGLLFILYFMVRGTALTQDTEGTRFDISQWPIIYRDDYRLTSAYEYNNHHHKAIEFNLKAAALADEEPDQIAFLETAARLYGQNGDIQNSEHYY